MKTHLIVIVLAALVAFVASPLSLEIASSIVFLTGFGCVFVADYARPARRLNARAATVLHFPARTSRREPALELAA